MESIGWGLERSMSGFLVLFVVMADERMTGVYYSRSMEWEEL